MNGMGIMLKSMGIDPEMLQKVGAEAVQKIQALEERLDEIQAMQNANNVLLRRVCDKLDISVAMAEKPEQVFIGGVGHG